MNWIQYLHLQVCCIFLLLSYNNQHPSFSLKNSRRQSCKTSLMLVNFLNCYFPQQDIHDLTLYWESLYIIFIYEKQLSWENYSWLVGLFFVFVFVFHKIEYIILSLLDCQVSIQKSTDIFKGISLLWAFTFLLLLREFSLFFFLLQVVGLGDDHFEWTLRSDLLATWTWMSKSHQIWDFSGIILEVQSLSLSPSITFWDSNNVQVVSVNVTPQFTQVLPHLFVPLFLCPLAG